MLDYPRKSNKIAIWISGFRALVSAGNIFSPNEKEAASLVGPGSPLEMIQRITELGAETAKEEATIGPDIVTLKCYFISHHSRSDTQETWEIPAFHTICASVNSPMQSKNIMSDIMDPTGCGNTFCGGFIIGWWKTRDLLTAGLWGSIAASIKALNAYASISTMACLETAILSENDYIGVGRAGDATQSPNVGKIIPGYGNDTKIAGDIKLTVEKPASRASLVLKSFLGLDALACM
eukprot:Gb_39076 [translate_table: standard]